ncbi:MAG TPA: CHASE3 domain-containing protein [Acidisarcina sp.]
MNVRLFKKILGQALLVPVLLLLAVAAALSWQILSLVRAQLWLDHSDQVTAQVQELQKLIIDQETGLRGYQVTSDRQFLAPFQSASPLVPQRFEALRNLVVNDPDQKSRLSETYDRYEIWLGFAQRVLAMPPDNARDTDLNLRGKELMDDVRAHIQKILIAEDRLRRARFVAVRRQVRSVLFVLIGTALVSGLLIAIFLYSRLRLVSSAYQASLDEAQRKNDELFQSKQWFETTLESIGDGVIACDDQGRIDLMNQVARQMTGWAMEDARGLPLDQVFKIINEETRQAAENPVDKVRRLNAVVGLANHTLLIRKDGTEMVLDDSAAPIRDSRGDMTGIVLIFRDVTVKRRSDSALIANEKLAVAGRLAASIAHEIHNPLDSVANLHFLLRSEIDSARGHEYLQLAEQELGRALQISRAMLSLYREPDSPISVDLEDLVESVLLLLERKIEQQQVTIQRQLSVVTIQGFPAELRQVFTNLILNAVDAAGAGGSIMINLQPETVREEPGALIEIFDTGPGIKPEIEKSLFQPFFTTKGDKGTGLGLWVSLGIVQKHGGTLDMLNSGHDVYKGALVRVYLPARTDATAIDRATVHTEKSTAA